jgi:NAD+ synthase (glutamine-hydrolysing)
MGVFCGLYPQNTPYTSLVTAIPIEPNLHGIISRDKRTFSDGNEYKHGATVMKISLAIAQINTVLGDVSANLEIHIAKAEEARKSGAELIVFPELSLTGYALQDIVPSVAISVSQNDPIFKRLLDASKGLDLVFGFVDEDARHRFTISSAYLSKGEVVHIHNKVYLPTYGLFDEGRFFGRGDCIRAFDTRFGRMGILICEDFWHASPPYLLWLDGAEILLLASASPGRGLGREPQLESAHWVEHINQAYASLFTDFVIHANRVGYEDGLNFWGGSTVFDPNGKLLVKGPYHQEALILAELDLNQLHRTRARLPLLRDERPELVFREMGRIIEK